MKNRESILGGLSKSLVIRLGAKGLGFAKTAVAAAYFGFGIQADSLSVALGVAFFFNLFNDSFEFIYARKNEEQRREVDLNLVLVVFSLIVSTGLIYFFLENHILNSLSSIIASKNYSLLRTSTRLVLAGSGFFLLSNMYSAFLRANRQFSVSFSFEFVAAAAILIFTILFKGYDAGLAWAFFAGQLIGLIFLVIHTHLYFKVIRSALNFRDALAEFTIVNSKTIFISMISMIYVVGEKFYGDKLDSGGLAIFNLANLLVGIATSMVPFHQVFSSVFKIGEREKSKEYFRHFSAGIAIYSIYATVFISIFALDLASLAAGYGKVRIDQIQEAAMQMRIICLGIVFTQQAQMIYRYMFLTETIRFYSYSSIGAYVISIGMIACLYSFGFIAPIWLGVYYFVPPVMIFIFAVILGGNQIKDLYFNRYNLIEFSKVVLSGLLVLVVFGAANYFSSNYISSISRLFFLGGSGSLMYALLLVFVLKSDVSRKLYSRVQGMIKR